ncbi:hypothetical protein ACHQM5_005324 [Ranunculus cassubicifolius]
MKQPPGYVDNHHPEYVCRLHRSLYGLKQAPRAWYHRLSSFLLQIGFSHSKADASLFIMIKSGFTIFLLVYVDDIILTGSNVQCIQSLITKLNSAFALTDLGPLHYFLGIETHRSPNGMFLSQKKYVTDLLCRTNMDGVKPISTPFGTTTRLSQDGGSKFSNHTLYRSVVGALQYLTFTRPDVSFAVNKVCQYMHNPKDEHWAAVKRILRYLKKTIDYGIFICVPSTLTLHAFSDADWAGCLDDRRSTSGYCIFLGGNLISWSARKQKTVSRSSTEAEYRGLAIATAEIIWIQSLLRELGFLPSSSPTLWCDNLGATYLTANPVFHARTKHIEIDYHFVRERVASRELDVRFISTKDQIADIFTKGLSSIRHCQLRDKLTVTQLPFNLRGRIKDSTVSTSEPESRTASKPTSQC